MNPMLCRCIRVLQSSRVKRLALLMVACAVPLCSPSICRATLIATFGDSNTAGGSDAYPGLLATELSNRFGPGLFQVANHGISGLTTGELVTNLANSSWLDEDPDVALIMIGGNDLWPILSSPDLATFQTVIEQAMANIQQAVDLIRTHSYGDGRAPAIVVSGYIPNKLANVSIAGFSINPNIAVQALNGLLANQLSGVDMLLMSNYEDVLDPATGKARVSLMRDNLHLNQAGRQLVAGNFADAVAILVPEPTAGELFLVSLAMLLPFGHGHWRCRPVRG